MTGKIFERRGDQVYKEVEDYYTGEVTYEWVHEPERKCACGRRLLGECRETKITTFTETYECGFVYRYVNHNGYADNVIEKNGKRVK